MAISITYLGSTSDSGGSGTTLSVYDIDTTGAKALVIAAKHDGAATTITPSANNDATGWTSLPKRSYSGGEPHAQIFYKLNPTGAVGDDPQIALAASRTWKYLAVWKITADTDVELIDETSAEGVGTSRNAGNLVATAASVAVYLDTIWTGGAHTPGGTWTERYDVDAGAFDRTGTGAETYAASSTFSGGDLWVGVAAAFQEVGSGATTVSAGNRLRPGLHPAAGPFNPAQFMPRRGSRDNPATGGGAITGSAAPTLTGATGSSTGTVNNRASAAPTLAAASASASGLITVAASAAPTLAAATAAAAGAIDNRATAAPATAGATAAASGIVDNRASAAPQLGAATASAIGTVGNVINGTAAITLGAATSAATALVDNRASAAVQLAGGTAAASGTIDNRASAAVQLGAATASASGAVGTTDIIGSAAPQLAAATASGIAQIIVSGAAAVTLAGVTASGSGLAGDVFVPIGGGRRRIGSNSVDGGSARIGSTTVRTGKRRIGSSNP